MKRVLTLAQKIVEAQQHVRDQLRHRAVHFRQALGHHVSNDTLKALSLFVVPDMGPMPSPWRRIVEPVIALVSAAALLALSTIGISGLLMFVLAGALAYGIIALVFGVRLDLQMPAQGW